MARGIGVFLACYGFLQARPSYDDLLARARAALATKDYQAAVTASQQAIGTDDRRWEAYAIAANAYTGQRLYGDAIESLQAALARAPDERKQLIRDALQQVRRLMAPSVPAIAPPEPVRPGPAMPAAATQPEIVLWKSIENSTRPDDFRGYLNSYPNGAYASIARLRLAAAQKMESSAREASDFKTFTLPVEHERSGMIYHWCYGHIRLTPEGAAYDGDRDRIGFSKVDVISVGVGPDGVEFRLKDGQRWQFSLISEADVGRRKIKDNQPGDYSLARLLAERWGWRMSPDQRTLVPNSETLSARSSTGADQPAPRTGAEPSRRAPVAPLAIANNSVRPSAPQQRVTLVDGCEDNPPNRGTLTIDSVVTYVDSRPNRGWSAPKENVFIHRLWFGDGKAEKGLNQAAKDGTLNVGELRIKDVYVEFKVNGHNRGLYCSGDGLKILYPLFSRTR